MLTLGWQEAFLRQDRSTSRLRLYGYEGDYAQIGVVPILREHVSKQLVLTMLAVSSPLTAKQCEQVDNDSLYIKLRKFSGKGSLKCKSQLRILHSLIARSHTLIETDLVEHTETPTCYICPEGHRKTTISAFNPMELQKSIWCTECRRPFTSTKWFCSCGLGWSDCPRHFAHTAVQHLPRTTKRKPTPSMTSTLATKKIRSLEWCERPTTA